MTQFQKQKQKQAAYERWTQAKLEKKVQRKPALAYRLRQWTLRFQYRFGVGSESPEIKREKQYYE